MTTATPVKATRVNGNVEGEPTRATTWYRPNVDILESAQELTLFIDMPGTRAEDIDVDFERGTLTVYGKVQPRRMTAENFLRREYGVGDFKRVFRVHETIDGSAISAEYADGVLTLHLPKTRAAQPYKIAVRTS